MAAYEYSKTEEEMVELATVRAAADLQRILATVERAGASRLLTEASGNASLLAVAHACYREAIMEVRSEYVAYPPELATSLNDYVGSGSYIGAAKLPVRRSRLRPVPMAPLQQRHMFIASVLQGDQRLDVCIHCGEPEGHDIHKVGV